MTKQTKAWLVACAVSAGLLTTPSTARADETLAAARELYASAAYDEALTMLNGLLAGNYPREERQAIELYRTLCLLAVGRKAEADRAIETMIIHDPLYRPSPDDMPPRLRSAFSDARKRMLPSIIQQKYLEAKAAFDRQDYPSAVTTFKQVLDGLADPDMAMAAGQGPLADIRTLAGGFHDLSAKALPPPPPVAKPIPAVAPAAVAPVVVPPVPKVYGIENNNVVPPGIVKQAIPTFQGLIRQPMTGIIEIIIDETGHVENASMIRTLTPAYDRAVLSAAKSWQYQPAALNGAPVKFRKLVQVNLVANTPR